MFELVYLLRASNVRQATHSTVAVSPGNERPRPGPLDILSPKATCRSMAPWKKSVDAKSCHPRSKLHFSLRTTFGGICTLLCCSAPDTQPSGQELIAQLAHPLKHVPTFERRLIQPWLSHTESRPRLSGPFPSPWIPWLPPVHIPYGRRIDTK